MTTNDITKAWTADQREALDLAREHERESMAAGGAARLTYLLPVAIDAEPELEALGLAEELGYTDEPANVIVESGLLASLDGAYNNGRLPDSLSWYRLISCDLPAGWVWLADSHGARHENGDEVLISKAGVLHVSAGAAPVRVIAAVLARFVGKVEN